MQIPDVDFFLCGCLLLGPCCCCCCCWQGQFQGEWSRKSVAFQENKQAVLELFPEKVRRHARTNEWMQYLPSFNSGGGESKENQEGKESKESKEGKEGQEEEENATPVDFLMPFDTFVDTMSHIHCHFLRPLDPSSWTIGSVNGKWLARVGGCATPGTDLTKWSRNPRYQMNVLEENVSPAEVERRKRSQVTKKTTVTNVIVSLRQVSE